MAGITDDARKFPLYQPSVGGGTTPPPPAASGFTNKDVLTIATLNVVPALSATPDQLKAVQMFVNGKYENINVSYTISGTTVTWLPIPAEYDLEVGFKVTVFYTV